MKTLSLLAGCILFAAGAQAQKYMTRTGRISFFSTTPVENIAAVNNEVSAVSDMGAGDIIFQAPVKSFKFERALMQEHFNENYMESDTYPKAEFKGKIGNPSAIQLTKDGVYPVTAGGRLTMHGISRDITAPGKITVKGNTITINAVFSVRPQDYGIKIPSVVEGKIAREIEVTVNTIMERR